MEANHSATSGRREEIEEIQGDVSTVATFFFLFFFLQKKPLYKYKKMRG